MPEATSFTALGAGNGFNECLLKVNVSGYDYWTTLSGWSKVSAPADEAESIAESRRLAMKFFWNGHALNCDATVSGTLSNDGSISRVQVDYTETDWDVPEFDDPILIDSGEATPILRTCIPSFFDDISKSFDVNESDGATQANLGVQAVRAMYDGATTDIDNFIGYGLGFVETRFDGSGALKAQAGLSALANAGVYAGGHGYTPANTTNDAFDAGYVTFEGMELFAYVEAKNTPSDPNITGSVNLSGLSAQCTRQTNSSPPRSITATASLSSIDFYTYPE